MSEPGPSEAYYANFASTSDGPIHPHSPPSSPLLSPRHTAAEHLESFSSESLYAILNLDRSASEAEIRDRYRSLASTFHPDRQRDDATRLAAHGRFQEIQRAYEVLTDDHKRTVYDLFGEEGLKTSWEVGPRVKSPEEMRKQFQKQAHEKRQLEAEALVKPRGDMSVVLDARAVFLLPSSFSHPERLKHDPISRIARTRPGRVSMNHSFEMPVNDTTQIVWSGQMITRNGQGGANVLGTVKHQFSPRVWMEVGTSFLQPRVLTGKATYTHDENTFVTLNAVQQTVLAPPRLSVTLGRRLYAQTTGFITYKSGFFTLGPWGSSLPIALAMSDRSALSVGLTSSRRDATGWTIETQAGLIDSHISSDWSTRILGIKMKFGTAVGSTDNISGFIDGEGKVTTSIRAGMTVQAELAGGITIRLRFGRLGQRVSIPILLSPNLNPYVLLGAIAIPAGSYAILHRFYILPRKRRRIAERVMELREEHAEFIAQKKAEAQQAILVMERPTASRTALEREKHGLVVISAHYGLGTAFTPRGMREQDGTEESVIDVTIPIQALVNDSKLIIPGGRAKFNILGFWDPCIGETKVLRVRYLFKDRIHQVTLDDIAALRAPLKAHILEDQ